MKRSNRVALMGFFFYIFIIHDTYTGDTVIDGERKKKRSLAPLKRNY